MTFRPNLKKFLKLIGVGLFAAIALGALALASEPFVDAVGLYIPPARWTFPLAMFFLSRLASYLIPDGGPAAAIFVIFAASIMFWTIVFAVVYLIWDTSRRRRSLHTIKSEF
jgi:hypothetical protein